MVLVDNLIFGRFFMELNIGFIGTGSISISHLVSINEIIKNNLLFDKFQAKISIKGFSDIDEQRLATLKKNNIYGADLFTLNPEELLNNKAINVIYITCPTKFHKDFFIQAAEQEKHIFIEKPLAFSIQDIQDMISVQRKYGILTQVGLVLRHCPVIHKIKDLIHENKEELGEILGFMFRDDQDWPINTLTHPSKWREDPDIAHAGCLFEHSIHDVDVLEYLFGDISKMKRVSAKIRYISPLTKNRLEDSAILNLEYENDLAGNLISLWHNFPHDERHIEIFFENGSIILDGYQVVIFKSFQFFLKRKKKKYKMDQILKNYFEKINYPQINIQFYAYFFQNLHFLESLIKNENPYPDLSIGLRAHEIIEKAYKSSKVKDFTVI